jgi:hypothetical protein
MSTDHAREFIKRYGRLFSPSGSSRWLFCSGSVALEKQLKDHYPDAPPEKPSIHASRGTVAHAIGAKCIENDISPYLFVGETHISDDEAKFAISVDNDLAAGVDQYVTYALSLIKPTFKPIYGIEEQLDLSFISPYMPYGTADFWCYQKESRTLYVVDYKNGVIDVDPENNTQLMIYALGVLKVLRLSHNVLPHHIDRVILVIAQPNAKNAIEPIREWHTSTDTLAWFHEFVRMVIHNASSGTVFFSPSESRCRWCKGSAICTERAKLAIESAKLDFHELMLYEDQQQENTSPIGGIMDEVNEPQFPPVDTLTPRDLGSILRWQNRIEDFLKAVGEKALELKYAGERVPGVKLVRGRTQRIWKNEESVVSDLTREYDLDDDVFFAPPKLRSPAQIEGELKKRKLDRAAFEELVTKPPGELKLAPVSDKRPEVRLESSARQDFVEFKK